MEINIRDGYKKTELGIIPDDWDVKKLGDIANIDSDNLKSDTDPNYSFKYISLENVETGELKKVSYCVFGFAPSRARRKVQKNDILVATVRPNLKSHLFVKFEVSDLICSTGFSVIRCNLENCNAAFIYHHFFADFIEKQFNTLLVGSNYPAVNSSDIKNLKIPLPPLSEQKAIAHALSDVDNLITAIDQLITKKRNLKQGTMQELLTGKKRLPGFSGKWEVKKLGDIGKFKNGINKGKKDFGFGYPFVNLLDIFGQAKLSNNSSLGLVNSNQKERNDYDLRKGDILFVRSSVKPEGVGLTSVILEDLNNSVYSGFLIRFRNLDLLDLDLGYKQYCFYEESFRKKIIDSSTVSANTNINQDALKNMEIKLPPTIEEQKAIAEILTDMDKEIEALEKKRDKYKAIKQGMMQELLTGKTRIIDN